MGIYISAVYNQLLIELFPFFLSFILFFGFHFVSNVAHVSILKKHTLDLHIRSAKSFHTVASLGNADFNRNILLANPALKIKQKMHKNIDVKVCVFFTLDMLTC